MRFGNTGNGFFQDWSNKPSDAIEKKRKFNEDKVLILNSSPKIGEVPVRAEEYDLPSKHFLL